MTTPQSWTKSFLGQSPTVSETGNAKDAKKQLEVTDSQARSRETTEVDDRRVAHHTIWGRQEETSEGREVSL